MCGIAAILNSNIDKPSVNTVVKMGEAIKKRGIHNSIYTADNLTVNFIHLPIETNKPQPCIKGNTTLWLNGYISNWRELRDLYYLEADSDTEVLTELIDRYGLNNIYHQLNGFFAVLYYDGEVHTFTDRYGIKQLYQYEEDGVTYICSEVKGIKAVCDLKICPAGVHDWHYSLGVMTDDTIYKGVERVRKLPFHRLTKRAISYEDAKYRLKELLVQSIKRNKHTKLKDGVLLSGGIDSGIIARYIKPEYCFSVDYLEEKYSEIENIKLNSVGQHLTLICNGPTKLDEAKEALCDPKVGSCYTNYAITELASKFVTILYSGAGGDEIFGGYPHRNNKDINDVIKRTDIDGPTYFISHDEYNWRFLQGVLIVEDRMGGAFGIETRYPLLDNDFVDFALSLPDEYLENKRILKDISGLDEQVINGKKKGFSNPHFTNKEWAEWLVS
jgi:asparagine synthase (glutamine-hydrolysing)